ncbi:hypothetical protein J4P41_15410, partial [Gluconobacter sp. NFX36]|uniref:hypothetical protein n=1 Tax=Gluconobacter sp. NFX36 TaxID=2819535 RepID=UPI003CEB5409
RRWTVICSKRRAKVTPETLNQSAKKLKSSDKRINKQFFDPSRYNRVGSKASHTPYSAQRRNLT